MRFIGAMALLFLAALASVFVLATFYGGTDALADGEELHAALPDLAFMLLAGLIALGLTLTALRLLDAPQAAPPIDAEPLPCSECGSSDLVRGGPGSFALWRRHYPAVCRACGARFDIPVAEWHHLPIPHDEDPHVTPRDLQEAAAHRKVTIPEAVVYIGLLLFLAILCRFTPYGLPVVGLVLLALAAAFSPWSRRTRRQH
jgi:hypothetical protein